MPHYKNGRLAQDGDFAIGKAWTSGKGDVPVAGRISEINPGAESCNAVLTFPVLGGVSRVSVTLGNCFHAADGLNGAEALNGPPAQKEAAPETAQCKCTEQATTSAS